MDYISRADFLEGEQNIYCVDCSRRKNSKGRIVYEIGGAPCRACGICDVLDDLEDFPAADVVEVIRCKECKYFNLNKWGKVNDIPLIVAHEICDFWGEGCKTDKDGYCSFAERREDSNALQHAQSVSQHAQCVGSVRSDLISRTELFNRLAGKHTKAEFYQVINDMPTEEGTLERACEMLAEFFDAPCNYTFSNIDVTDVIPAEWCEENCDNGDWKCWRKLYEVWEE